MTTDVACKQNPYLFDQAMGSQGRPGRKSAVTMAKAVCAACPVKAACLELALERGEEHGVWGGLTAYERRALTRGRPRRQQYKDRSGPRDYTPNPHAWLLTPGEVDGLCDAYEGGMSAARAAARYGIHKSTALHYLHTRGIEIRTPANRKDTAA